MGVDMLLGTHTMHKARVAELCCAEGHQLILKELAEYTATVVFPWEHALMSFYEYYSMNMPLLFPVQEWCLRLVFHAEGNLG